MNNAAVFMSVPVTRSGFQDIAEDEWDRVMAVNVKGLWLCSRAVAPAMQERRQGSIVNIASNMAYNGGGGMMHYVVSKAAVVGFTRVLARELGPDNVRVNTLAPGSTASEPEPTEAALQDYERSAAKRMLQRIEKPEDVVGTALVPPVGSERLRHRPVHSRERRRQPALRGRRRVRGPPQAVDKRGGLVEFNRQRPTHGP